MTNALNWRLSRALVRFSSRRVSAQKEGWGGTARTARYWLSPKSEFDQDLLTKDRNLSFRQVVGKFDIAIVVLHSPSTQLHHTLPLMVKVLAALPTIKPGDVVNVYP